MAVNGWNNNIYTIDTGTNPINGGNPMKVVSICFNGTGTTSLFQVKLDGGIIFILGYDSASKVFNNVITLGGATLWNLSSGTITDGTGYIICE